MLISTIKREERCAQHSNKIIEFFCFTCKVPLCTVCALGSHKSCAFEELGLAVGSVKQRYDEYKPILSKKSYAITKLKANVTQSEKQCESDYSIAVASVKDLTDKIHLQLRQKESAINLSIEDHVCIYYIYKIWRLKLCILSNLNPA